MNSRIPINFLTIALVFSIVYVESKPISSSTSNNHELLTKLGLQKIRGPNTHHRKRLAVESRHHSRSDDSHMFVIKLPPHPHYYVYNQPETNNNIVPMSKKIPVGFKSNGKPGKIYHWNIPVIKKIVATKKANAIKNKHKSMKNDSFNMIDLQKPESWNEVLKVEKPMRNKPLKPSYYIPTKPKKSNFMKYFPGNGKPHSFYVIEKSKKAHYHRLLP